MASIQRTENIDVLNVRKIFAKGDNNTTIPANSLLATDGNGGTQWVDMSTIQAGVTFNTFVTTQSTFKSGPYTSQFAILDGVNAGLIPAPSTNAVTMYAKAFGQINVDGQDSIYSFDTYSGTINSNVKIAGTGIINISTDTTQNKITFYSPNDATSSLSTVVGNFTGLNNYLSNSFTNFNSPFSTFIYDSISSFSTAQGPVVIWPDLLTTFSSFSTTLGPVVKFPELFSTISSFSTSLGPLVQLPQMLSTFSTFSTSLGQTVQFHQMNSTFSSFSTALQDVVTFPQVLSTFSTFSTSLGQLIQFDQMNSTFSTFSTNLGPVIQNNSVVSTIVGISTVSTPFLFTSLSSFSTALGPVVTTRTFFSTLSTNNNINSFSITNLYTSTVSMAGIRQPFIQYGTGLLGTDGSNVISLGPPIAPNYKRYSTPTSYIIQLTYAGTNYAASPLTVGTVTASNFVVYGDPGTTNPPNSYYWTTFGTLQ